MPTIYLEPSLLAGASSDEAGIQLHHLSDSGFSLVVLGDQPIPDLDRLGLPPLRREELVYDVGPGDWLLTAEPDDCARRRLRGLRTMLIGGAAPAGPRPASRCDVVARDLRGAVLEILARQAMPERGRFPVRT